MTFGDYLKARWAALGIQQAEFCRRIDSPAGWVQQVREGKKSMPLDRVPAWAKALELNEVQTQRLYDLAAIGHLPPEARLRFLALVEAARG